MTGDPGETECHVRVVVRVRPLVARERLAGANEALRVIPGAAQVVADSDHSYAFDDVTEILRVFETPNDQATVFREAVEPLLEAFVTGYNCTILAYGQTGSGKTHTMGTGMDIDFSEDDGTVGIIPRAVDWIQAKLHQGSMESDTSMTATTEMYVSFLEIYNEDIVDLLNPSQQEDAKHRKGLLAVREDAAGHIYIAGIREERVANRQDIFRCLQQGALCRTTKSTQMNLVSSRSHAIFTLTLRQRFRLPGDEDRWETRLSKLHFVDLAGSERLKRTQASGARAKESIAINGGLLALGNVISALGDESKRAAHVPYRDSKLTRLLQDSLGGNSRTLMIACVSPSSDNLQETINTLKYAHRARNIRNRVAIGAQDGAAGDAAFEVAQLKKMIASLRQQLQQARIAPKRPIEAGASESGVARLKAENADLQRRLERSERDRQALESERDSLRASLGLPKTTKRPTAGSPVKRKPLLTGSLRRTIPSEPSAQDTVVEPGTPAWFTQADSILDRARSDLTTAQEQCDSAAQIAMEVDPEESPAKLAAKSRLTTRMELALASFRSDLAVKMDLVEQLETSKREFLLMRDRFEERIRLLQANFRSAQAERDQAALMAQRPLQPTTGASRGFLGATCRQKYEERIKKLGRELNDLKDRLREASHSASSKSAASETLVRNLRASLSTLKTENARLQAQVAEDVSRLRASSSVTETDLREARARERKALDQAARWKKAHDFQRTLLKRRIEQVLQARAKIRQLVGLLRRNRVDLASPSAGLDFGSPGWRCLQGDSQSPLIPARMLTRRGAGDETQPPIPFDTIAETCPASPLLPKRIASQLGLASVSAEDLQAGFASSDGDLAEAASQMALDSSPFQVPPTPRQGAVLANLTNQQASPLPRSRESSPIGIIDALPKSILRASPLIPRRRDFFARLTELQSKTLDSPMATSKTVTFAPLLETPTRHPAQRRKTP